MFISFYIITTDLPLHSSGLMRSVSLWFLFSMGFPDDSFQKPARRSLSPLAGNRSGKSHNCHHCGTRPAELICAGWISWESGLENMENW
jgi:hypothetical protein